MERTLDDLNQQLVEQLSITVKSFAIPVSLMALLPIALQEDLFSSLCEKCQAFVAAYKALDMELEDLNSYYIK